MPRSRTFLMTATTSSIFDVVEPGHHFVEQQQLGPHAPGPWRARAACGRARRARRRAGRRGAPRPTKSSQSRACVARLGRALRWPPPAPNSAPTATLSSTAEPGKRLHDLEGAADAEMRAAKRRQIVDAACPRNSSSPSLGAQRAADQVDERRLAGAVGADQTEDLAAPTMKADVVDARPGPGSAWSRSRASSSGAVLIADAPGRSRGNSASPCRGRRGRDRARPRGMKITASTITDAEEQAGHGRDFAGQHLVNGRQQNAPITGPSTVPGPPNTAMITIFTLSVVSKALAGSMKVIQ